MHLVEDAHELQDDLVRLRRTLHTTPETGLHLPRTQETVLRAIDGLGLEVTTGRGLSSVTAVLRGARPGPTVLLRGDMDALPLAEKTGLDYASRNGSMHACGHDLHTAMLAGAARLLAQHRDRLDGDVVFMFQPGEEGHDGARLMLDEGLLDASGTRPQAAYALHVTSAGHPLGQFAGRAGPTMSAVAVLTVTVHGSGGHGSMPHRAKDPVQAACEMVTALQTWITRGFDVFDPVVLSVGTFHAGTQHNIIPETATFEASVRSFSPGALARLKDGTVRVCEGLAAAHGVRVDARFEELYPATVNDPHAAATVASTVAELYGEERFAPLPHPLPGSEDFSRVIDEVPGAMVFLGAPGVGTDHRTAPNNHSPYAAFDDGVLADGAALYAALAVDSLAAPS
ncbi:M20 family metallopeptidase [Streptomyces sp. ASQP_92]|uniref:M20 metallopeptidase family protein n=1 Tax=Streptomyces sp. ASQP_92 TaxID=2979116 RepID=UPI0021BF98C7|nr:M20 family metallopeptidase [Streptomyces sp. ASQP_92]MCT9087271.1 M20 family metallopeptidase [Streptomyces sp. ASQP_92]